MSPSSLDLSNDDGWLSQTSSMNFTDASGIRGSDLTGLDAGLTDVNTLLQPTGGTALGLLQGVQHDQAAAEAAAIAAADAKAAAEAASEAANEAQAAADSPWQGQQPASTTSANGGRSASISGSVQNTDNIAFGNGSGGYTYPFNNNTYGGLDISVDVSTDGGVTWESTGWSGIGGVNWSGDFVGGGGGFGGDGFGGGGDLAIGGDAIAPVVLDLTGGGINITALSSSSTFVDATGNGYQNRTAWAGAGNGVLVLDLPGTGLADPLSFDFTRWDPTATTDMQALRDVFDTNHDGKLDAGDADWTDFKVQVTNSDGTTTLETLNQLGITSINLNTDNNTDVLSDGSKISGETSYTKADGTTGTAADVAFAYDANGYATQQTTTVNADGSTSIDVKAFNTDGSLANETISTVSANGLSRTVQFDDAGNGVFDRTQTDVTVANADGSRSETVSNFDVTGTLTDRTATTTSADGKTVTIARDVDGNGTIDQTEVHTTNAAGSHTVTVSDFAANGTLEDQTVVTTSADGLSKTARTDINGDGIFDLTHSDVTVINADGSRIETISDLNSDGSLNDRAVTVTSATGAVKTTRSDLNGDGVIDLTTVSTIGINADGSSMTTQKDLNGDGSLRDETITNLSGDGLTKTIQRDLDGNGVFDVTTTDATVHNADGSQTETVTDRNSDGSLRDRTVTTSTPGSALRTVQTDSTGAGIFNHLETVVAASGGGSVDTVSDYNADGSLRDQTVTTTSANGLSRNAATDSTGNGQVDLSQTQVTVINADGSSVVTSKQLAANGSFLRENVVTTSADRLSITTQSDTTGVGSFDTTRADITVLNANGSRIETVTDRNADGSLRDQSTTTTSADRHTVTVQVDSTGTGNIARTQSTVTNADGSIVTTVSDFNADGSLKERAVTTKSASGLSTTAQSDTTGSGTFDRTHADVTVLNANGSRTETVTDSNADGSLVDRTVMTTGANGMSVTTQRDTTGSGNFDQTRTDVTVLNADGSKTETVTDFSANGAKEHQTVTTTSASGLAIIEQEDNAGSGTYDQTHTDVITLDSNGSRTETMTNLDANGSVEDQTVTTTSASGTNVSVSHDTNGGNTTETIQLEADGSKVDTIADYHADGSLKDRTVRTTSANGLSTTIQQDTTGAGTFDQTRTDVVVLNADGSRTETVTDRNADGSILDQRIVTTSASGLSGTTQSDTTGSGTFDKTHTDVTVLNANGGTTETVTDRNADGSLHDQTITTKSASQTSVVVQQDLNGDGHVDQTQTTVTNADGSVTATVADLNANGLLRDRTVTTVSASGLSTTTQWDTTGSGSFNRSQTDITVINANSSRTETITDLNANGSLKDRTVTTTSANGLSVTTQRDTTGSGSFDQTDTDITVLNADGSKTETVTDLKNGYREDTTVVTTSANGLSMTTQRDTTGDGTFDETQTDVTVLNANGSKTETVADRNADGSLRDQTVATTSADGSTVSVTHDDPYAVVHYNLKINQTSTTTLKADGSRVTTLADYEQGPNGLLLDSAVTTTSADGLSITTQLDTNGDGTIDQSRTNVTVLNADGSRSDTITDFNSTGFATDQVIVRTSANGLSKTTQWDNTGVGSPNLTETDIVARNPDGSKVETITDLNVDGSLREKVTTTTSADQNTVTEQRILNGATSTDVTQRNADGSVVSTISDSGVSGSFRDRVVVTTSASGLSITTQRDTTGAGTFNEIRTDVSVLNADGSRTETVTDLGANGVTQDRTVTTTSSSGLSTTSQYDLTGAGTIGETKTDATIINSDGSRTETVTYSGVSGALISRYVETTSANGLSIAKKWDTTGTGVFAQSATDITVVNTDGSRTETVTSYNADGSMKAQAVTITTADGLSEETKTDTTGNGVFDQDQTSVKLLNADGSTTTTISDYKNSDPFHEFLKDQEITTTSADGRTISITRDINGDGTIDQTETKVTNVDGSVVTTITDLGSNGAIRDRSIVTMSADGLTTTTQWDLDGNGTIDRTRNDVIVADLDGSKVETITDVNSNGSLYQKGILTTSADGRTSMLQEDMTGAGFYGHLASTTVNVDGSSITTAKDLTASGTLIDGSTTTVSADGLTRTVLTDSNGDGAIDEKAVTQKFIDGSQVTTQTELNTAGSVTSRSITTLSADGKSETIQTDSTNAGWFNSTETLTTSIDGSVTGTLVGLYGVGSAPSYTITAVSSALGSSSVVEASINGFSELEITGDANSITPTAVASNVTGIQVTGNRNVVDDTLGASRVSVNGTGNVVDFAGSNNVLTGEQGNNTLVQGEFAGSGNTLIDASGQTVATYEFGEVDLQRGIASIGGNVDTLVGFTHVDLSGWSGVAIGANSGHDVLQGSGTSNTLVSAGAGNTLMASEGSHQNTLVSGAAGNTLIASELSYSNMLVSNSAGNVLLAESNTYGIGNTLIANAAGNTLVAGAASGSNTLVANVGGNTLLADAGSTGTTLVSDAQGNLVLASGADAIAYYAANATTVNLNAGTAIVTGAAVGDQLVGVTEVGISGNGDTVIGRGGDLVELLEPSSGWSWTFGSVAGNGQYQLSGAAPGAGVGQISDVLVGVNALKVAGDGESLTATADGVTLMASDTIDGYMTGDKLIAQGNHDILDGVGAGTSSPTAGNYDYGLRAVAETLIARGASDTLIAYDSSIDGSGLLTEDLQSNLAANTLIGFSSADIAEYTGSNLTVNLMSGVAIANGASVGDTLIHISNVSVSGMNDTIIAGTGDETLTGGSGTVFEFGTGSGQAFINGFDSKSDRIAVVGTLSGTVTVSEAYEGYKQGVAVAYGSDTLFLAGEDQNSFVQEVNLSGATTASFAALSTGVIADLLVPQDGGTLHVENLVGSGSGNNTLTGDLSNNVLTGGTGDDTLDGGGGSDTLVGGGGNDTYVVDAPNGQDAIINGQPGNSSVSGELALGTAFQPGNMWFSESGSDLVMSVLGSSDEVVVKGWFANAYHQLQMVVIGDQVIGTAAINSLVHAMNNYAQANPNFNPQTATVMPAAPQLQAAISVSWVTSIFIGTEANNTLDAGATSNATLVGGGGSDVYEVASGYGHDLIINGVAGNNGPTGQLVVSPGVGPGSLWVTQSGNDLAIQVLGTTDQLTIKGWFANSYSELAFLTLPDGTQIATSAIAELAGAMTAYQNAHPAFSVQTATAMPSDPALLAALNAGWLRTIEATGSGQLLNNVFGSGMLFASSAGGDTLLAGNGSPVMISQDNGNTLVAAPGSGATAEYRIDEITVNLATGVARVSGANVGDALIGITSVATSGGLATLIGGNGADTLSVSGYKDVAIAGSGANTLMITANGGDTPEYETLIGGAGTNVMMAWGSTHDTLIAGGGADTLSTGDTNDVLIGGSGLDTLEATGKSSTLLAGAGVTTLEVSGYSNTLIGGNGPDVFLATGTYNTLFSESGRDTLGTSGQYNTMIAFAGTDTLWSTGTANTLKAFGSDTLISSGTSDELIGDGSDCTLIQASGGTHATAVTDLNGRTVNLAMGFESGSGYGATLIGINDAAAYGANDELVAGAGPSTLTSDLNGNVLIGGSETDALYYTNNAIINLAAGTVTESGHYGDVLTGIENVIVTGMYNTVIGGAGSSTLTSDGWDNTLIANHGGTVVAYTAKNATVNLASNTAWIDEIGMFDTLVGIKAVEVSGVSDTLIAGAGGDTLIAAGNGDQAFASSVGNTFIAAGGAGNVLTGGGSDLMEVTGGNGNVVHSAGNSVLMALGGTNSTLIASHGDTLIGENANSTLLGDLSHNTLIANSVQTQADYVGTHLVVDLATGIASDQAGNTDTLIGVVDATTAGVGDTLIGSTAGGDYLQAAGTGSFAIAAGSANTLVAGRYATLVSSTVGGNTLIGSSTSGARPGVGVIWYSESSMNIDLDSGVASAHGRVSDALVNVGIVETSGQNETLAGGAQASTLISATVGNNTLIAGTGATAALYTGTGVSVNLLDSLVSSGNSPNDTLVGNFATVTVGGSHDVLIGGNAPVELASTGTSDTLIAGNGATTLTESFAGNTLIAGAGPTTLDYRGLISPVIDLSKGVVQTKQASDTLIGSFQGVLVGSNATVIGTASGAELLDATGYYDTLIGGEHSTLTSSMSGNTLIATIPGSGTTALYSGNGLIIDLGAGTATANNGTTIGDKLIGITTAQASGSHDTLVAGSSPNAYLSSTGTGNTLVAGTGGQDVLTSSGAGYDYFQVGQGDGVVHIDSGPTSNGAPTNELDFGAGVTDSKLWFVRSGNDLLIDVLGTNTRADIGNWFAGPSDQLQKITAGGLTVDSQISQLVQAMATYSGDYPGFSPASLTQMPPDVALQGAIAAAWHA